MPNPAPTFPIERVEHAILVIRGEKVMLSTDLAALYEVEPRTLIQAVKRNLDRFPADFMFQLTWEEVANLRSQSVILNEGGVSGPRSQTVILKRGANVKYLPYAFTEQGVAMLSSVLRSKRAIQVNVEIMRTFVRLRQMLVSHRDLARKIEELEKRYDAQFKVVFDALRALMEPPVEKKRRVGFQREEGSGKTTKDAKATKGKERKLTAGR
jgi:hypothetical protein